MPRWVLGDILGASNFFQKNLGDLDLSHISLGVSKFLICTIGASRPIYWEKTFDILTISFKALL